MYWNLCAVWPWYSSNTFYLHYVFIKKIIKNRTCEDLGKTEPDKCDKLIVVGRKILPWWGKKKSWKNLDIEKGWLHLKKTTALCCLSSCEHALLVVAISYCTWFHIHYNFTPLQEPCIFVTRLCQRALLTYCVVRSVVFKVELSHSWEWSLHLVCQS